MHQHAEAGVVPPLPLPAVVIGERPRAISTSRLLAAALLGPIFSLLPLIGAATMPTSAVDYGTKIIMLSMIGASAILTHKNPTLLGEVTRTSLMEACQDFYDKTFCSSLQKKLRTGRQYS
jgi:hypothetical protein